MKVTWKVAAAGAALLMMTACSSSDSGSGGSGSPAPAGTDETLATYFNAFATNDSGEMKPMLTAAEPGSPAEWYAEHQINGVMADEAANESQPADTVTIDGGTVTYVYSGLPQDATEQQRKDATQIYKDFQFAGDGKIVTWTTDPGGALQGRITKQEGRATSGKVTITAKTAYVTNTGDLSITYDVKNKSNQQATVTPKGYINPDKRQAKVQGTPYNAELSPGSFTTASGLVENGEPGGKLVFTLYVTGSTTPPVDLTVPITK